MAQIFYIYLEMLKKTFSVWTRLKFWKIDILEGTKDIIRKKPKWHICVGINPIAICLNTKKSFFGNNREVHFFFWKFNIEEIYFEGYRLPVADTPISKNGDRRLLFNTILNLAYLDNSYWLILTDYLKLFYPGFWFYRHPTSVSQFC